LSIPLGKTSQTAASKQRFFPFALCPSRKDKTSRKLHNLVLTNGKEIESNDIKVSISSH
jgi:hypothetical protein